MAQTSNNSEEYDLSSPPLEKEATDVNVQLTSTDIEADVPDGGLKAWMSVLGGWIVMYSTFGYAQSFGVYQDLYTLAGASTPSNISWIGSFQLFMMFAMGLPAGKLFDLGYFHHVQIAGSFIFIFSLFMLSLADISKFYQIFLSQGVGVGLGCGMMFLPALSVQAHHFRHKRALAMGIVLTGSSIGGIIHPIMLNQLFHGSTGFAWGVRASAFMMLGLLIIANLIMTTRLPPKRNAPKPDLRSMFGNKPYLVANIGTFLIILGLYFPYFYLQLFVDLHGMSRTLAFYTLAILNAASVFGRTIPNVLADRFGKLNVFIPISAGCGILGFVMFATTNTAAVIIFCLLYGFFSGGFVSLIPPALASMTPDIRMLGIYMGVGFFINSFAALVGTPITGALLQPGFVWHKPILFSSILMTAGAVFMFWCRNLMAARVGKAIV